MLYHVADRTTAAKDLRRVLATNGRCVVVTNGAEHMRALRRLVETAVRDATPGWEMRNPSTHVFSLENGAAQLRTAFDNVECVRPIGVGPVVLTDAAIAADYVASVADHYQAETTRPWHGRRTRPKRRRTRDQLERCIHRPRRERRAHLPLISPLVERRAPRAGPTDGVQPNGVPERAAVSGWECHRGADGGAVTNLSQKNLTKGVEWSRSGQRTPGC